MSATNNEDFELEGTEQFIPLNDSRSRSGKQTTTTRTKLFHEEDIHDTCSVGSAWAPLMQDPLDEPELTVEAAALPSVLTDVDYYSSIQDRLVHAASDAGTSALLGSLELLKMTAGLTLSTTGKIVGPSVRVTQELLIPALWDAFSDFVRSITPQRVKDWVRILGASVYHFITVLRNTHSGQEFQSRIVTIVADIVDCLSSDTSRQVITDTMASAVKLAEAMHTPEFRSFLDQLDVLGARLVDAAASGRNKQLVSDMTKAVWTGVELASDPQTIIALAEVTATLCHTLEMEEALYRRGVTPGRRWERNRFTQGSNVRPDLMQDPDVTVEQVIMSSLGGIEDQPPPGHDQGPPRNVTVDQTITISEDSIVPEWNHIGRDKVDTVLLEEQIRKRAARKEQERMLRTTITMTEKDSCEKKPVNMKTNVDNEDLRTDIEDLVVETVDEDDFLEYNDERPITTHKTTRKEDQSKQKLSYEATLNANDIGVNVVGSGTTTADTLPTLPASEESESPVSRFYRTLDEILSKKRISALGKRMDNGDIDLLDTRIGANGRESVKRNLTALRRAIKNGDQETVKKILQRTQKAPTKTSNKHSFLVAVVAIALVSSALVWFSFGCYGMYIFFKSGPMKSDQRHLSKSAPTTQEVVIRVVREIIHVDHDGQVIDQRHLTDKKQLEPIDFDKVAECLAEQN